MKMVSDVHPDLRGALRQIIVSWLFGAAWMYMVSGAIFTRYAKLLHVSNFGFGILATVPFIGALAQLPASLFLERYGHRKLTFLWCAFLHRILWLVIAVLPWLVPPSWQWPALLSIMLLSTVLANISTPAWLAWMAELIPGQIRGRYFSRRIQFGQAVGLVLSFLTGLVLDWPQPDQQILMRNIISTVFAFASLCGIADILLFLRVPDTAATARRPALSLRGLVHGPLKDRNFRRFLGYSFSMTFATGFIGQFVWLYLFDEVGMSNSRANLLLVSIPLAVGMLSYPFWGRIVDRFGSKVALITAGSLVINGATVWIFVTRDSWIPAYLFALVATAAWAGMDIAGFNLLLRMTQDGDRRNASNTAVIAINSLVVAIAGTLSGIFGGSIAEWLGNDWRVTILGRTLTYHSVLFACSAFLRLVAVLWLFSLKESGRKLATREAFRYVANNVYSNILQATFFPARVIVRLAKASRKI
jgi:MFS family permease